MGLFPYSDGQKGVVLVVWDRQVTSAHWHENAADFWLTLIGTSFRALSSIYHR
jgi:hypothetical protein